MSVLFEYPPSGVGAVGARGGGCGVLNWSQYLVQRWCCWSWGLGTRWRFNTNGIWWSKSVLLGKQSLKNLLKTSSTWRREISNVGGDWSRMKPLYSMERNKCFSTYSVPWSRIYGVYSTPGVGLERNMCYSGVGTRLCRSCAEVVQKLCRSCAEAVQKFWRSCAHCLHPLCIALLAPTVSCIACSHCALHCLRPIWGWNSFHLYFMPCGWTLETECHFEFARGHSKSWILTMEWKS